MVEYFFFCSATTINYISNVCKVETRNNDNFSDLTYAKANEYDFQSTLILRQDYFMQGLDSSNYAFSFGVETPFIPKVSADKNDSNYWFNKIKNVAWNYLLSWNPKDISKGFLGKLIRYNNDKYTQSIKLLDMTDRSKYQGFNLIRFSTTTLIENRSISINGFNFSLYNATDWNGELNDGKIWQLPYKKGAWYRLDIHIENAAIWIVNNLPGMKEIYKFVNGIVHVFSNVSELFNNIGNLFAFDITFKIMLSSILVLAMVNGLLCYF
ncbi:spiroplasma phage ORF1-like family protein [Spiroplasma sp. ChiS]|uniref:spiroplasma phage ORF1-like family protein n=1 Tax=Spiroplasma sp. ChiS TaxID=2099885 RepID=UPI0018F75419|nr:DUF3688 family protein [Spiroplasma sp. ChiS]